MKIVTLDFECFAHDWLVVIKDHKTKTYTKIWNDNDAFKACLDDDIIFVGFNIKHYDQFLMKAVCADFSPEEVKKVNDYIILGHNEGWTYEPLRDYRFYANIVDVMDDMQVGQSLKSIEGHLFMNIEETNVDFNISRALTAEEKELTEKYCTADVDATEKIFDLRKDYFTNKIKIGRLAGLDEVKAMGMTNAKLTAAMLKAKAKPHDDERQYMYRDNLLKEYIPQEVFNFFNRMYDSSLSDDEVFKGDKLKLNIGDCAVVMGYGGIHGAIPNLIWHEGG
ncbi:MAG: hypothetical protein PUF49_11335 [Firmicutes bacterium]|nr:hypothetical protein [Bacillota bacterium]